MRGHSAAQARPVDRHNQPAMSMDRVAVIMAGGSGERFWPLSRRSLPKQFLRLDPSGPRLIEMALDRLAGIVPPERTYIATSMELGDVTREICRDVPPENVLTEPERKNTAGAVGWTMAHLPDAVCVGFFPADHAVSDIESFARNVRRAYGIAEESEALVTIGIKPARAETGYGYMEADEGGVVKQFHEKPDQATAERYLRAGSFYWNAGMFFWQASAFWGEMEKVAPEYTETLRKMARDVANSKELFHSLPSISIDNLLMEKAASVRVVPAEFDWDDVGSLDALARWLPKDESENSVSGAGLTLESQGNLIVTDGSRMVCLLGVENLIVIQTEDATLICPRDRAQDIRRVVEALASIDPKLV